MSLLLLLYPYLGNKSKPQTTKHPLWPPACTPSHQHCTDIDMGHLEVLSLLGVGLGGLEPWALWVLTCV